MRFLDPGDPETRAPRLIDQLPGDDRRPVRVASAPGRVNLIGEHLDYNGGVCLPLALPYATWAAVAPRPDGLLRMASQQREQTVETRMSDLAPGAVEGWAAYVAGVVWALRERGLVVPGLDVVVDSTVPVGAGLSSSASLECSVAVAVADLLGIALDETARRQLATDCVRAETEMAGAPTGGLDQAISLEARAGHALLLDFADDSRRQVRWEPEATGVTLLVVDTRASHTLVEGDYGSRREACEEASRRLGVTSLREVTDPEGALARLDEPELCRRARHVFTETDRVRQAIELVESGDWEGLGRVFAASHASLRDDYEVSCQELDVVVDVAGAHGALGSRMTGGGFGGSAIALVPQEHVGGVVEAVTGAFADRDWSPPHYLEGTASDGARGLVRRG